MSRSANPSVQSTYDFAGIGFSAVLRTLFSGLLASEPAATQVYAENARLRATGRGWLM